MRKQWRVAYFGCLGSIVTTGRLTKRKAIRFFRSFADAISLEKVEGRNQRRIFKEKDAI